MRLGIAQASRYGATIVVSDDRDEDSAEHARREQAGRQPEIRHDDADLAARDHPEPDRRRRPSGRATAPRASRRSASSRPRRPPGPTASAATAGSSNAPRSSCAPVTAKKNGVKISPSGRISCSSSSRASVSATMSPATNAPMMAASPMAAETSASANMRMNAGTSGVSANSGQVNTSRLSPRARRAAANPRPTSPMAATATSSVDAGQVALRRPGHDADEDEGEHIVDDRRAQDDPRERPVEDAHVGQHPTGDADARRGQRQADERGGRGRPAEDEPDGDPDQRSAGPSR